MPKVLGPTFTRSPAPSAGDDVPNKTYVDGSVSTHAGAANPHTVYQLLTGKGAASGYASLGADTRVPPAQLGTRGAVRVRQTVAQNMATGWNIIAFDAEDEDILNEFNLTNERFTPADTGWYLITVGVTMAFGAPGRILISLGTTAAGGEVHRLFDATSFGAAVTGLFKLTGGTSYTVQMNNASGAAANTTPGGAYCFMNIRRLPDAA